MKKCKEIRKRVVAMLCAVTMTAVSIPLAFTLKAEATDNRIGTDILETNDGNLNRIPWNNNMINTYISAGFSAITAVLDVNQDGYMDIMSQGRGVDSLGTMVYYGTAESQDPNSPKYMVLDEGLQVREPNNWLMNSVAVYQYDAQKTENNKYGAYVATRILAGSTYYMDLAEYVRHDFDHAQTSTVKRTGTKTNPDSIDGEKVTQDIKECYYEWLYDVNGDSKLDLVWYIDDRKGEYGDFRFDKFDDNGVWGDDNDDGIGDDDDDGDDDPYHNWIVWLPNTGSNEAPEFNGEGLVLRTVDRKAIDSYGWSDPQMQDWDGDGDLDLICGSFIDEITYYENKGAKDDNGAILFERGRAIPLLSGGDLKAELYLLELTNCDWNKDGYMDLVVSEEDGRCFLVQNTGTVDANNTPIMENKGYFKAPAGNLQLGCLPTPVSVDWDGDGDEDIISGDSAGFLNYIENVTPKDGDLTNPSWGPIKRLKTPDGEVYRIKAGYNGSTQGPNEKQLGYTMVSVADWDGDGVLDIMHNNIWGKVMWHKGIQGKTDTIGYAQPIEVEWSGETPKPEWLWWNPEGDELVTQWRTTPFMIDLPLDEDGDGVATGDELMDLVIMDHEGYLSFFQRYKDDNGELKLKEGQRIFTNKDGTPMQLVAEKMGGSGKNSYILVDWDQDGDLDLFKSGNASNTIIYYENISKVAGKYEFVKNGEASDVRKIKQHDVTPTVCDWNQDDIPDLIMANEDGFFYYLLNPGVEEEVEETEPYAYLQDYLVAHWDFEGDATTALLDKATKSDNEDTLAIYDKNGNPVTTTDDISVVGGVATVKDAASLRAEHSDDLNITGEMTIFMKVYVDSIPTDGIHTLVSKGKPQEAYSVFLTPWHEGYWGFDPGEYKNAGTDATLKTGEWKELAVTVSYTDTTMNLDYYLSSGTSTSSGTDFLHTTSTKPGSPGLNTSPDQFYIGAISGSGMVSSVTRKFDDIQIYNKALTADEINSLMPDTIVEDALVAHWDFEGDDALKDKAAKGNTADGLTIYDASSTAQTTANVTLRNGVASIKGDASLRTATETAGVPTDLDITGELTMFMRMKVDALGWYTIASKGGASGAYRFGMGYGLVFTHQNHCWSNYNMPTNEWREVAVVVNYDKAGDMVVKIYVSNDISTASGSDFTLRHEETFSGKTAMLTNDLPFIIGNVAGTNNDASTTSTHEFDDIQIYKKALTPEQLNDCLPDTTVQDSLVAHWDFEGDDENELKDKASSLMNDTSDNLQIVTVENDTTAGTVEVSDGVATIQGAGVALQAADSDDLDLTGESTIFMRALVEGSGNPEILSKHSGSAAGGAQCAYALAYNNGELYTPLYSWGYPGSGGYATNVSKANVVPQGVWKEIAIVLSYNNSGNLKLEMFMSNEETTSTAEDFTRIYVTDEIVTNKGETTTSIFANTFPLTIGNKYDLNGDGNTIRKFDDIRLYKKALTPEQFSGLCIEPEEPVSRGELVAHWDFDETDGGVYADKATGGNDADTLTAVGTEGTVTIADGVATITGNSGLQAEDSVDLSQTGAMTIFVRMKTTGTWFGIVDKLGGGSDSAYRLHALSGTVEKAITSSGFVDWSAANVLDTNVWREMALVIDKNSQGVITYKVLVSKGEATGSGNDFLVFAEGMTSDTRIVDNIEKLTIGNISPLEISSATRSFDDVRIYNYALTGDELADIMPASGTTTSTYLKGLKNNVGLAFRPSNTAPAAVNTTATTVSFTPIADDANQVITIDGNTVNSESTWTKKLNSGENEFTIIVTNGDVSKTYTIKVNCTVSTATDLQAAIDAAKAIEQGSYTDSSYQALKDAIASAESKVNGTVSERKSAAETLATAVSELTERLRMEDLSALAEKAKADGIDTSVIGNLDTLKALSSKEITELYNNLLKETMGIESMTLQPEVTDSIAMVYKGTISGDKTPTMTFTVNGETTEAVAAKDGEVYTFTYPNVYAQDMAQTIEATLTVGDYSRVYEYSFLDYCVNILGAETLLDSEGASYTDEEVAALKDLVVDLVKYAASVQEFRGDVTGTNDPALLTSKLNARQRLIDTYTLRDALWTTMGSDVEAIPETSESIDGYVSTALTGDINDNYKWSSMRLVLKDEVNLRCKFTASDVSNLVVKVTINGTPHEYNKKDFLQVADKTYQLDFGEIYANEYGETVTFEFVNDGQAVGQTMSYSVNTYLFNKRNSETDNLPQLLLAIYKYGLSANVFSSLVQ